MKLWEIIINGVKYTSKDGTPVKASQMWTAIDRCLKVHFKKFPKQRFCKADIYVKCLGESP